MIIDLTYAKKHLKITHNNLDDVLTDNIKACEEIVLKFLNQQEDDLFDEYGQIPHAIKNAVSMLVGSMIEHPESMLTVGVNINPMAMAMLKPYKKIVRYVQ